MLEPGLELLDGPELSGDFAGSGTLDRGLVLDAPEETEDDGPVPWSHAAIDAATVAMPAARKRALVRRAREADT